MPVPLSCRQLPAVSRGPGFPARCSSRYTGYPAVGVHEDCTTIARPARTKECITDTAAGRAGTTGPGTVSRSIRFTFRHFSPEFFSRAGKKVSVNEEIIG